MVAKVAKEKNAELVHPYNDIKVITGAGTAAVELFEEQSDLDYVLVPIGGGGLSSGTVLSTKYFSPNTQVIGVQPFLAADAKDSLKKGSIQPQYPPKSMA
jgi:threonine dehydratase